MLAVPQNMGFLACALPIESYSLELFPFKIRSGIKETVARAPGCPQKTFIVKFGSEPLR